jgi:hypothetical protein
MQEVCRLRGTLRFTAKPFQTLVVVVVFVVMMRLSLNCDYQAPIVYPQDDI